MTEHSMHQELLNRAKGLGCAPVLCLPGLWISCAFQVATLLQLTVVLAYAWLARALLRFLPQ
jgi:hypothetical protein